MKRTLMWVVFAVLMIFAAATAWAQEQQPNEQQPSPQEPAATEPVPQTDTTAPLVSASPVGPVDADIHPAGKAVPWLGTSSPLRWGDFSIGNFTYQHVNDHFQPLDNSPSANLDLSIFRTSIVFDHAFRGQRLVLQYEPQLAVLNGKLAGNAGMNNWLALGTTFAVTPRLSVTLKDAFAHVNSRQLYPPGYLAVDQQAGNLIQNNFLQNAGSYLTNETRVVIAYLMSPRTTLTIAPAYKYVHATNDEQVLFLAKGHVISNAVALTHALTERQSIGAVYTVELLREDNAGGDPVNSYFHTVGLYYANQLTKGWWMRGEIGANFARYPDNFPSQTTVAGGLSIVRTFTSATAALGYWRGRIENNFLTPRIGDLIQASYTQHFTKRIAWNNGGGYYREEGGDPRNTGNLGSTGLDVEIFPNLFISGSYTHMFQKSSTLQLLSGIRNTYVAGLRWEPHLPLMH